MTVRAALPAPRERRGGVVISWRYASLINGFTAQGYNIILAFTDFGDAALPAYRSAFEAGTTMVPYFGNIAGEAGTDYAVNPYQDSIAIGKDFFLWLGKALDGKGNVLMMGGQAGAASSTDFLNGFKEGLKDFPDLKLLDENYIVTNWNPADAQKATAGLTVLGQRRYPAASKMLGIAVLLAALAMIALDRSTVGAGFERPWRGDLIFVLTGTLYGSFSFLLGRWRGDAVVVTFWISVLSLLIVGPWYALVVTPTAHSAAAWALQFVLQGVLAAVGRSCSMRCRSSIWAWNGQRYFPPWCRSSQRS